MTTESVGVTEITEVVGGGERGATMRDVMITAEIDVCIVNLVPLLNEV